MTNKFQNKFRIPSTRLQNWDYCWVGAYFITICTKNREHYFGEIENGKMQLSSVGVIANVMWHEIKNHSKTIDLDVFVVMPNHIHGILILYETNDNNIDDIMGDIMGDCANVETGHALSLQQRTSQEIPKNIDQQRFQNIGTKFVSSIIGSYKSAVTKHSR